MLQRLRGVEPLLIRRVRCKSTGLCRVRRLVDPLLTLNYPITNGSEGRKVLSHLSWKLLVIALHSLARYYATYDLAY